MGFMDKIKEQAGAQDAAKEAQTGMAKGAGACPDPSAHYVTEVNKGSLRMQTWQTHLNAMYGRGYRLAQVFEQDGNTVQVYEHHFHA